ncbi:MAG: sigma-70 family RNA polymerase sigma factor [Planctomycetota bacterium]
MSDPADPRELIERMRRDGAVPAELFPVVYGELRRVAQKLLRAERKDHTLQATALVHEAWIRLSGSSDPVSCETDRHFLRLCARTMRRVLVDHARGRQAAKRGDGAKPASLGSWAVAFEDAAVDVLQLQDALSRLAALDPVLAEIVELRYFAGLTVPEVASTLQTSVSSVERGWRTARAYLRRELAP